MKRSPTAAQTAAATGRRRRPLITRANVVDVVNRFLTLVVLVMTCYVLVQYRGFSECVAKYDDQAARSTQARSAAADQDRQAEDAMWQAFADAGDPTKVKPADAQAYAKTAFEKFLNQRASARKQRADHPLPASPSQVCR